MSNFSSNRTVQALQVLQQTSQKVDRLLQDINAENTGYSEIRNLFDHICKDLVDASERSKTETIRMGILGGRGSGKSTLANALIGVELLPNSAIVFCTSIPTTIRYRHQYSLEIQSELQEYCRQEENIEPSEMKKNLSSICQESNNPGNSKRISRIAIGVPKDILDSKEIVDVPGFTKGNPLHQAFAERYAKYYCDVCLVLINNAESVEVGDREGLDALAETFKNRLDSTAFIINKCDLGSNSDIDYIESKLREKLNSNLHLFRISSQNSLVRNGEQYGFQDLLGYLSFISSRKTIILVKSLLERLITNFSSLRDLCHLNRSELDELYEDIKNLLNIELESLLDELNNSLFKDELLPNEIPKIEISEFNLPSPIGTNGPYEYANRIVTSLSLQASDRVNEYVQQCQAQIYRAFNSKFEDELGKINQKLYNQVNLFERKFNISSFIQIPKVENSFRIKNFNPSQIERLKPPVFRLWFERLLPGFLAREINFWLSPISIKVGPLSVKLGLPVGIKRKSEMTFEIKENIPESAIQVINSYIYDSLDKFVQELNKSYTSILKDFENEWRKCFRNYLKQIETAKIITEPASLKKIDNLVNDLENLSQEITQLMS